MPTNILMPALSPTMEKGNLAKWLKKEGDKIKSGDVIAEIETDKATMEYEATDEGTLAKIVVPEGTQDVAVNSVIAVMAVEGEDAKAAGAAAPKAAPPVAKPVEKPVEAKAAAAPPADAKKSEPAPDKPAAPAASAGGRVFASPLAKRLAKEAGVDLSRVSGSGPHGRVIARDQRRHVTLAGTHVGGLDVVGRLLRLLGLGACRGGRRRCFLRRLAGRLLRRVGGAGHAVRVFDLAGPQACWASEHGRRGALITPWCSDLSPCRPGGFRPIDEDVSNLPPPGSPCPSRRSR